MATKARLLFLYMVPETGHQKAAEAIIKTASVMDPRLECVGLDAVSHAYPFIGNVFNRMYLQMLKSAPAVWDYLYDNPDVEALTRDARGFLTLISSFRTQRLVRKHHPVAVVCTQAVPATAMAAEKKRGKLKIPLIGVVTDFGVHSYWLHKEVDLYLVAHEDVKRTMVERGIAPERIRVTGIPIDPDFGRSRIAAEERARLRLDPGKMTILVMGGSRGMGPMDEMVRTLLSIPYDFQIIVVCGRNRSLQRDVATAAKGSPHVLVLGYMRDLSRLMAASDLLITKPGGLTCSEALARELPLILTNPIPGQEERNVRFLTRHRVAMVSRTPEDLMHAVTDLLRHPKSIAAMKQRARLLGRPMAAWEAARNIFDVLHGRGGSGGAKTG